MNSASSELPAQLFQALDYIRKKAPMDFRPRLALTLGSGLGGVAQGVRIHLTLPFAAIPGFPAATVAGHVGELHCAELSGVPVLIFSGRFHFYEGHAWSDVVLPMRLAARLGARGALLTSAVGSMRPALRPGDLAVIADHINGMGGNPLIGPHAPAFGERFPDVSACYDAGWRKIALAAAKKQKVRAQPAVYYAVSGPSYETPAEIRAFQRLGGDVVGMSVAPEAIVARQMGLKVLALCSVANYAAGLAQARLNHADVLKAGQAAAQRLSDLIRTVAPRLAEGA